MLVVVLVLVVLAIGGGVAVCALRPQLPFELSDNLPEVPKVEIPKELPFDFPWEQEPSGSEEGAGEVDAAKVAVPSDGAVAPEASAGGTGGIVANEGGSVYETAPGDVIEMEPEPLADPSAPNVEGAGAGQGVEESSIIEEGETSAPAQEAQDVSDELPPLVTPDL